MRHSPRVSESRPRMVSRFQLVDSDSLQILFLNANSVPKVGRVKRITKKSKINDRSGHGQTAARSPEWLVLTRQTQLETCQKLEIIFFINNKTYPS